MTGAGLVSVVIPVRDAGPALDRQLAALSRQRFAGAWEIVVADNGSGDDSVERATRWADRAPLRVVDASARPGPGAARNEGVAHAKGDALLFCDADDEVHEDWVERLATRLADAPIVGGAIVHATAGAKGAEPVPRALPTMLGWLPYAQTASCSIRRALFDRLDGFEESLIAGEDVDLSWRAQLDGAELAYEPAAVVRKYPRSSTTERIRQHHRYGMADVDLYLAYARRGAQRAPARAIATSYAGIVVRTVGIASPEVRARWAAQVGRRAGRLHRSAQRRVWFP